MDSKSVEVAIGKLYDKLEFIFHSAIELIPNFLLAITVIIAFVIISKIISKKCEKALSKVSKNLTLNKLSSQVLGFLIISIGVFLSLGILHLDKMVVSLLAGVGILGLGFSFAFQHVAADLLSGVILSIRRSVNIGDLVKTNDVFGNVLEVDLRTTKILNVKGQVVEVPNRLIIDNHVSDFSYTGFRRIDVKGKMNFHENLSELRAVIEKEMATFDFIFPSKLPNLVFDQLDFEKVDFTLRVWMIFTKNDGEFLNARSACIEKLSMILSEQGVKISAKEIQLTDTSEGAIKK